MSDLKDENGARILRVDLSTGQIGVEELDSAALRRCIGGYALGAKYLFEEVPAGVEWSDPENRLMLFSGVLGGTIIPGSGGVTFCAKGPLTGGAAAGQAMGDLGAFLRRCGYLGVIVRGAGDHWSYLVIDENGKAELRDAEHLRGKDTWETVDLIGADLGKRESETSIAAIGPAGENLVRWSGICSNKGHVAMHNGLGAVMGSKRLKAVVVARGKKAVPVADPGKLREIRESLLDVVKANKTGIHYEGTLAGIHRNYESGNLPVRNYTTSQWDISEEEYAKFTAPYMYEHFDARRVRPCWACPNRHCQMLTIAEGPYAGLEVEESEYEQVSAFSANVGINEIGSVMMLGNLVDRLGLDTNEGGWMVAFAMECFEKGILTLEDTDGLELTWGNAEAARQLLIKIAKREGIGALLAEGVRLASRKIGHGADEIGVYTMKGATPRGHDHRARWHEMFDHCVSESGALENSMISRINFVQFGLPEKIHPYDPDMIAKAEAKMKGSMQLEDSALTCRFNTSMNVGALTQAISAVTGWDFGFDEGMEVGRRAVNTMRTFNIRHGLTGDLDRPSPRYSSTPFDGPAQGQNIRPHFDRMLQTYYEGMGWDEKGRPLPETLRALGLDQAADELYGAGS